MFINFLRKVLFCDLIEVFGNYYVVNNCAISSEAVRNRPSAIRGKVSPKFKGVSYGEENRRLSLVDSRVCSKITEKLTFILPQFCDPPSTLTNVQGCSDQGLTRFASARSKRTKHQRWNKGLPNSLITPPLTVCHKARLQIAEG